MLVAISMVCAYLYTSLSTPVSPESTPPSEDSTPTIVPPTVTHTAFPKLPLLNPTSDVEYVIGLSGSGEDRVLQLFNFGDYIYAFGETDSFDHDFSATQKSVFIAKLTLTGTLLSVKLIQHEVFLSAKVLPSEIAVLSSGQEETTLSVFDLDLCPISSFDLPFASNVGALSLGENSLYALASGKNHAVAKYDFVSKTFGVGTLGVNILDIVAFEYIVSPYFVANTPNGAVLGRVSDDLTATCTTLSGISHADSAVPSLDNKLSFTVSGTTGGKSVVYSFFADGNYSWGKEFFSSNETYLIKTVDGYLFFASDGTSSTCLRLCSHGDVIDECILSLTGLMPVDFYYDNTGITTLFLSSLAQKKSVIATVDGAYNAQLLYEFSATPHSFVPLIDGIAIAVTANSSGSLFEVLGVSDGYIVKVK